MSQTERPFPKYVRFYWQTGLVFPTNLFYFHFATKLQNSCLLNKHSLFSTPFKLLLSCLSRAKLCSLRLLARPRERNLFVIDRKHFLRRKILVIIFSPLCADYYIHPQHTSHSCSQFVHIVSAINKPRNQQFSTGAEPYRKFGFINFAQ